MRAHSAKTLNKHPQREEEEGRVHAQQKSLLVVGNLKGEVGWLAQRQSGEARQDCGSDMSCVDANPEGNATFVIVQSPCGIEKNG